MSDREPGFTLLPKDLEFKVKVLLILTVATAVAFVLYVLYARGVFEAKQQLTLVVENAEGVSVGMDLTFSGFAIGRVRRIALGDDGKARVEIDVPRKDAGWLRTTSIFTLERSLVGASRIRVFSANLQDAPLEDHAVRPVLRGDATEELPRMIAALKNTLENIEQMTAGEGSLQASLANVRTITERMGGRQGVLGGVLGGEDNAKKVVAAIDRANALLGSLGGVATRLDGMLGKTDQRVFGAGGVMDETQKAVAQTNAILGEVRDSLKKVDALLADAQTVSANAKAATTDLGALRAEVDATLRKVANLIDEINRKWPFERQTGIKLP